MEGGGDVEVEGGVQGGGDVEVEGGAYNRVLFAYTNCGG
jgi:hypothetical protein